MSLRNTKRILMLLTIITLCSCSQDGKATNGVNKNPEGLGLNAASLTELSSLKDICLKQAAALQALKKTESKRELKLQPGKPFQVLSFLQFRAMTEQFMEKISRSLIAKLGLELKPTRSIVSTQQCDAEQVVVSLN